MDLSLVVPLCLPLAAVHTPQPPRVITMRTILSKWTQPRWSPLALALFSPCSPLSFHLNDGFCYFLYCVFCNIVSLIRFLSYVLIIVFLILVVYSRYFDPALKLSHPLLDCYLEILVSPIP
jgi:hypothetical protein